MMRTTRADLQDFIAWRVHAGARPRSTARQLSSFRRFFRYLVREGVVREDPTAQIAMPKIGRSLPKSLTEEEVEALLSAPGRERSARQPRSRHARGAVRDRACASPSSSTCATAQVNINQGVIRILGKGNRERLIPLGEEAMRWLTEFASGARSEILLERQTDYLFPTRRGDRMTRQAFWHIIKRYARKVRHLEGAFAAHAAACVRHASAQSRRGSARRADAARATVICRPRRSTRTWLASV